ncbi:MAG: right-handed parallel beta-helix repeat-containing protein [Prolixibacteraceae bacterium]|jgi:hypothetical protein|nr:right-handed parallel beta-helix repeat-containing protein [Prolixibacteraceae bacterium]
MKTCTQFVIAMLFSLTISAKEYHVAKNGNDNNQGTTEAPLLTIQTASLWAQPGDTITVHEGTYRERVTPPRGGLSDTNRIVYRAAENEKVEIKGSEIVKGWKRLSGNVWKNTIPNSFFGNYNPYTDIIHGDWFNDKGRSHHTGEVYLNGRSLWEAALFEHVLNPPKQELRPQETSQPNFWYCESDKENTYLFANFGDKDPNEELVEINVRQSCFYPDTTGINYITVRGFQMRHAATQWAPPTAEQIGLIGTNWSKGWIIENNVISDSKCSGITLGKHGDEFDNTSENSAEGYVETIHRAIKRGWSKENIGHHIVRNNTISHCEQTGICGSLGAIFSTIENNHICKIWEKRQFTGAEMGGIKIHASIDMLIKNNTLIDCGRGLWLDWMAQGTQVTGNLFFDNTTDDIFVEVNHGPFVVENNILLSDVALRDWSEGGAYVHNLFAGTIDIRPQKRFTPFHKPHSTGLAGLKQTSCGDNRFFNNIFWGKTGPDGKTVNGLCGYDSVKLPVFADGNVYINGACTFAGEHNFLELKNQPGIRASIDRDRGAAFIDFNLRNDLKKLNTQLVTSDLLGKALIPDQHFETREGLSFLINYDFTGRKRSLKNPTAGPFEDPKDGKIEIKLMN